ncbi:hypothetical protein GHT06_017274 [Daphnia sinensis]|uniref:Uncharacterized protein n=1 Tax=Daphnia sinensis TaxID=1820382 RepID=A0AAD5PRR9_9CRUS|nr:hypothetical protein GHT06_017274 [Daphnia sinensis]
MISCGFLKPASRSMFRSGEWNLLETKTVRNLSAFAMNGRHFCSIPEAVVKSIGFYDLVLNREQQEIKLL